MELGLSFSTDIRAWVISVFSAKVVAIYNITNVHSGIISSNQKKKLSYHKVSLAENNYSLYRMVLCAILM